MKAFAKAYLIIFPFLFFFVGFYFAKLFSVNPSASQVLSENTTSPEQACYQNGCQWVNNTCNCSGSSSTSQTPEPTPTETASSDSPESRCKSYGCSWTGNSCICPTTNTTNTGSTTSTSTPKPTPTYTTSSSGTTTIDRLSSVDPGTLACIKERLTASELEIIRFLVPKTATEEEQLRILKTRAQICFETFTETKNIEVATKQVVQLASNTESCLINAVGETAFGEINSGSREPTAIEKLRSQQCFASTEAPKIAFVAEGEELGEEVESCLALAVGEDSLSRVSKARLSLEQREKVQRCFGESSHPLSTKAKTELSPTISSCMKNSLGEARFAEISTGKFEPTEEEKELGRECFAQIHEVQKNLLPPPPEEVPFLEESSDLGVYSVDQLINRGDSGVVDQTIVLKGFATPDSVVDIAIFSDPIVVTTKTDENGEWIYELKDPVEGTTHVAYATVQGASGERVRSSVFNFEVVAASDLEAQAPLLSETEASQSIDQFVQLSIILVISVVLLVIIVFAFIVYKRNRKANSEDAPGPVN